MKKCEKLSVDDTKFGGEPDWLSALSVTIAGIAASLSLPALLATLNNNEHAIKIKGERAGHLPFVSLHSNDVHQFD
jgi:hypothetical protein